MRKHKSYGIPALAHRVSGPGRKETACGDDIVSSCSRDARNPFLSTCCTITKTRSLEPLPYVNWMRIAGVYGSAHIKIGQGLLYEVYYERWTRGQNSTGLLGVLPWGCEYLCGQKTFVFVRDCIIATRLGSGVITWLVNKLCISWVATRYARW